MPEIFIYHARYPDDTENFETAPGHLGHLSYSLGWYGTGAYGVLTNQAPPSHMPILYRASIDTDDMLIIETTDQFDRVMSCAREMYAYAFSEERTQTALKRVKSELFQLAKLFPKDEKLKAVIKRVRAVLEPWFDEYIEYFNSGPSSGDVGIEMNRLPNGSGQHHGRNKRAPWTVMLLQGHIEGVMFAGSMERENNDWRHGAVIFDFTILKPYTYKPDEGGGSSLNSRSPPKTATASNSKKRATVDDDSSDDDDTYWPKAAAASSSKKRATVDDDSSDDDDDSVERDHPMRPPGAPLLPSYWILRPIEQKKQWVETNWGRNVRLEMFGAKKPRR